MFSRNKIENYIINNKKIVSSELRYYLTTMGEDGDKYYYNGKEKALNDLHNILKEIPKKDYLEQLTFLVRDLSIKYMENYKNNKHLYYIDDYHQGIIDILDGFVEIISQQTDLKTLCVSYMLNMN